jgi:hypothetical protein
MDCRERKKTNKGEMKENEQKTKKDEIRKNIIIKMETMKGGKK